MRKNRMMRLASGLLVLTLLSTCIISGTYAKYVTTGRGSDTARVAKFGVKVTAAGTTFADEYAALNAAGVTTNSVVSTSSGENVVAPGTSGEMAAIEITGTPEVAVHVEYDAKLTLTGWAAEDNSYYCPIEIKVGTAVFEGNDYESGEEFASAVEDAIEACSKNYAPNTNMNTAKVPSVSWRWPFEAEADGGVTDGNDVNDTYLGEQAAVDNAAVDNAATIGLEIKTTVTQID